MSIESPSPKSELPDQQIIIVSGLPRSGTSMMMKILQAGGISPLTDGMRLADDNNPQGYFEFERVKRLPRGDTAWLADSAGKAVKIISALIKYLPDQYQYNIIFMQRSMSEILDSQRKMLIDRGKNSDVISDQDLAVLFEKHNREALSWIEHKENIKYILLNYNEILAAPENTLTKLKNFLNADLDFSAMVKVVDQSLYRNRNKF